MLRTRNLMLRRTNLCSPPHCIVVITSPTLPSSVSGARVTETTDSAAGSVQSVIRGEEGERSSGNLFQLNFEIYFLSYVDNSFEMSSIFTLLALKFNRNST